MRRQREVEPAAVSVNTTDSSTLGARPRGQGADALIAGFVTQGAAPKSSSCGASAHLGSFGVTGSSRTAACPMDANGPPRLEQRLDGTVPSRTPSSRWGIPASRHVADAASSRASRGAYTAKCPAPTRVRDCARRDLRRRHGDTASRLINLSARAFVGTNANVLIARFVIAEIPPRRCSSAESARLTSFGVRAYCLAQLT